VPITHEKPAAIPQMSTSNEVVKAALSEGIRARQVVLDQHVENLVEIGKICGQSIENGNKDYNENGLKAFRIDDNGNIIVNDAGDILYSYTPEFNLNVKVSSEFGSAIGKFNVNLTSSEVIVPENSNSKYQAYSNIASLADGGWIISWVSDDQKSLGIYSQRYDKYGQVSGGVFQSNVTNNYTEWMPRSVGLSDGGWITTWEGEKGLYFQKYDKYGNNLEEHCHSLDLLICIINARLDKFVHSRFYVILTSNCLYLFYDICDHYKYTNI
jgi:hypothetical protein